MKSTKDTFLKRGVLFYLFSKEEFCLMDDTEDWGTLTCMATPLERPTPCMDPPLHLAAVSFSLSPA